MARISLKLSARRYRQWQDWLESDQGRELSREPAVLGDLVIEAWLEAAQKLARDDKPVRRRLDKAMRRVLPLFNDTDVLTPAEIELVLGLAPGQGRALCQQWVEAGFLEPDPIHAGRFVLGRDVVRETREITHRTALYVKKIVPGPPSAGSSLNKDKK